MTVSTKTCDEAARLCAIELCKQDRYGYQLHGLHETREIISALLSRREKIAELRGQIMGITNCSPCSTESIVASLRAQLAALEVEEAERGKAT